MNDLADRKIVIIIAKNDQEYERYLPDENAWEDGRTEEGKAFKSLSFGREGCLIVMEPVPNGPEGKPWINPTEKEFHVEDGRLEELITTIKGPIGKLDALGSSQVLVCRHWGNGTINSIPEGENWLQAKVDESKLAEGWKFVSMSSLRPEILDLTRKKIILPGNTTSFAKFYNRVAKKWYLADLHHVRNFIATVNAFVAAGNSLGDKTCKGQVIKDFISGVNAGRFWRTAVFGREVECKLTGGEETGERALLKETERGLDLFEYFEKEFEGQLNDCCSPAFDLRKVLGGTDELNNDNGFLRAIGRVTRNLVAAVNSVSC